MVLHLPCISPQSTNNTVFISKLAVKWIASYILHRLMHIKLFLCNIFLCLPNLGIGFCNKENKKSCNTTKYYRQIIINSLKTGAFSSGESGTGHHVPSRRFLLPALPFPRSEAIKPADLASVRGRGTRASERRRASGSHEMVCIGSLLRALVLRAAASAGRRRGVLCGRAADVRVTPRHGHGWRGFRAVAGRMMLDSSDPASPAAAAAEAGQVQPQRRAAGAVTQAHDGGYASGGWER